MARPKFIRFFLNESAYGVRTDKLSLNFLKLAVKTLFRKGKNIGGIGICIQLLKELA